MENRLLKVFILSVLSFVSLTSVLAKEIKQSEILVSKGAIQVGAFKERKNILNLKKRFSDYNIFVEKRDNLRIFYIVNIEKREYLSLLKEVKRAYPAAFNATQKIENLQVSTRLHRKKLVKNQTSVEDVFEVYDAPNQPQKNEQNIGKRVQTREHKRVKYDRKSGALNVDTILKTRKKFF